MVALEGRNDVVGRLLPAEVLEHEHARQQERTRVHLVLPGILRGRAMGGLEDPVPGHVVDVPARSDPDAADLGRQSVGEIVAVKVRRRDDVELVRAGEDLLKGDVGDGVLHKDLVTWLAAAVVPADGHVGELVTCELVAPVAKRPLGELLDVPFVHEGDTAPLAPHRVLQRGTDEALGTRLRDRLDADARVGPDRPAELLLEIGDEPPGLLGALLQLETCIDVFGVLPEDDHVDLLGMDHGRGHAREPTHGPQAYI